MVLMREAWAWRPQVTKKESGEELRDPGNMTKILCLMNTLVGCGLYITSALLILRISDLANKSPLALARKNAPIIKTLKLNSFGKV